MVSKGPFLHEFRYAATASANNPEEQARFFEMASLYTRKSFLLISSLQHVVKNRLDFRRSYPLLILYGDKDLQLVKEMAERWHQTDTSSQRKIIANAGHCANMDKAEDFNRLLLNFLQESSGTSSEDKQGLAAKAGIRILKKAFKERTITNLSFLLSSFLLIFNFMLSSCAEHILKPI